MPSSMRSILSGFRSNSSRRPLDESIVSTEMDLEELRRASSSQRSNFARQGPQPSFARQASVGIDPFSSQRHVVDSSVDLQAALAVPSLRRSSSHGIESIALPATNEQENFQNEEPNQIENKAIPSRRSFRRSSSAHIPTTLSAFDVSTVSSMHSLTPSIATSAPDASATPAPQSVAQAKPIRLLSTRRRSSGMSIPFAAAFTLPWNLSESSLFKAPFAWTERVESVEYDKQPLYISVRVLLRSTDSDADATATPVEGQDTPNDDPPKVVKPKTGLGLTLDHTDGKCVIASIDPEGPLLNTEVSVGDAVISINGYDIEGPDTIDDLVQQGLEDEMQHLTVVCQRPMGNSSMVAAYAEKPHLDAKIGISLRSTVQSMTIYDIRPDSLFADSLLGEHYRVLFVNGHNSFAMTATDAVELLKTAPREISIVARVSSGRGVVLGSNPEPPVAPKRGNGLYFGISLLLLIGLLATVLVMVGRNVI